MKVIVTGHRAMLRAPIIISAALVIVVCFTLFFYFGSDGDTATAAELHAPMFAKDDNTAVTVSALLGTLENFGARDIDQALTVWAEGVASRNGMSQYSVMSDTLKEKYLEVAGDSSLLFPTSSTRIDGWYVAEIAENEDGSSTAKIRFNIDDGTSSVASAELTLEQDGDYCVVSTVAVESALYEFTGIG